jgi:hypothetical protein
MTARLAAAYRSSPRPCAGARGNEHEAELWLRYGEHTG